MSIIGTINGNRTNIAILENRISNNRVIISPVGKQLQDFMLYIDIAGK
jgi:hypothetical protein